MLSFDQAKEIICSSIAPVGPVTAAVEHSLGRQLAGDIVSDQTIPGFDNSQMDGYAVRSADVIHVPRVLAVTGEIRAGDRGDLELKPGEAIPIMTGAPIPAGSDAVIQQEWTERESPGTVKILKPVQAGHNVRKAGADCTPGLTVLKAGRIIRPSDIGVLASIGLTHITVMRTPVVAILPTGNELIPVDHRPARGQVRNSNGPALAALVRESLGDPLLLEPAPDDPVILRKKISEGLKYDALITAGGVSVGSYDLVQDALRAEGVEIKFWKVNMKPGMPFLFGMRGNRPVFGLPGNPVSCVVTFLQLVRPAIRILLGRKPEGLPRLRAAIGEEIRLKDTKRHFIRGIMEERNGTLTVRTTGPQVSNMLSSLVRADCLIVVPESTRVLVPGDIVDVEVL